MALTYKNQITGRVVTVLEPDELGEKLKTVKRRGKPMDPKLIHLAKKRRTQTIKKMNDSWKWARASASSQSDESGQPPDLSKMKLAELQSAAAERGIDASGMKSKAEVIEAIESAGASTDNGGEEQ